MAEKAILLQWVQEALRAMGGKGTVTAVARHIWANHEPELQASGDLFYTWQYDMRWAATQLRKGSIMRSNDRDEPWELL